MDQQVLEAINLFETGQRQKAQQILAKIIKTSPENEHAWLWLAICLEDVPRKRECLQRALTINPQNSKARQLLKSLDHANGLITSIMVAARPTAVPTPQLIDYQTDAHPPSPPSKIHVRKILLIVGALILASLLYFAAVSLLFNDDPSGLELQPGTATAVIAVAIETPTAEPAAVGPVAVQPVVSQPVAGQPVAGYTATATSIPTATPAQKPTAVPSPTSIPTQKAASVTSYLSQAQTLTADLQTALGEVIKLVGQVDFSRPAWSDALQSKLDTLNRLHKALADLAAPEAQQAIHNSLLKASSSCARATIHLQAGLDQQDIDKMAPAAGLLTSCRNNLEKAVHRLAQQTAVDPLSNSQ